MFCIVYYLLSLLYSSLHMVGYTYFDRLVCPTAPPPLMLQWLTYEPNVPNVPDSIQIIFVKFNVKNILF
jgi:hypothetical protein